jgi:hypothetical protein
MEGMTTMLDSLFRLLGRTGQGPSSHYQRDRNRARLQVEALEDRLVPTTISGFAYIDCNHDGIFDAGDSAYANSTIQLFNSQNQLIGTTTTDSTGAYQFTTNQTISTAPQTQEVDATFQQSTINGTQTQTVQQFNSALGTLTGVQIVFDGDMYDNATAQNLSVSPTTAEIKVSSTESVTVGTSTLTTTNTDDRSANLGGSGSGLNTATFGTQFSLTPQTVTLNSTTNDLSAFEGNGTVNVSFTSNTTDCACGGGNMDTVVNSVTGAVVHVIYTYTPNNSLQDGAYTIVEAETPSGFVAGTDTVNNQTAQPIVNGVRSIAVTIVNGGDSTNNNFGQIRLGTISGTAYIDTNNSGTWDWGEGGLGNVAITLSGTNYLGQFVTETTMTGMNGFYSFANLLPGQYAITRSAVFGYTPGAVNLGSQGGAVVGNTVWFTFDTCTDATEYNFGEVPSVNTNITPPIPTPVGPPTGTGTPTTPTSPPTTTTDPNDVPSKRFFLSNWYMF